MEVIKKKVNELKNKVEVAEDKCDDLQKQVKELLQEKADIENANRDLQQKCVVLDNDLESKTSEYEIMKHRLTDIEKELDESELKNSESLRKWTLVEGDLERAEESLAKAKEELSIALQCKDEHERAMKHLVSIEETASNKSEMKEAQLKEARYLAEETDKKYEEVARRVILLEKQLDKAEQRGEDSESKVEELLCESKEMCIRLKAYEAKELQFQCMEDELTGRLEKIKEQRDQAEHEKEQAQNVVSSLTMEVNALERKLEKAEAEADDAKSSLEQTLQELGDM